MKFCSIPPGENPMADAWNLVAAAWHAQHAPQLVPEAKRMAKTIAASVTDWEETAADLAVIAAVFADFSDRAMPEEVDGKRYERPTEKIRLDMEQRAMQLV
jgi:hypothetical protein